MGSKLSTTSSPSRVAESSVHGDSYSSTPFRSSRSNDHSDHGGRSGGGGDWRQRARSLTAVLSGDSVRSSQSNAIDVFGVSSTSPTDILSVSSSDDNEVSNSYGFTARSLPVEFFSFNTFKCPFCSRRILPDDIECHLVICYTKPPLNYNEDILTEDKGECVICLEEMLEGNKIARLPCLCIYHKKCIDAWFNVNRSCPEHPID